MTTRRKTSTTTLMAGWLFADLLLGLTIIMLGAQAPPPSHIESVADTARFQPEPFPSPPASTRLPAEEPSPGKPPGSKGEHRPEEPAEKKKPGTRPGPSPSPCTGLVGGVRPQPVTLSFRVTPGATGDVLAAQVRQELRRHRESLAGRHVGMLLTFGSDSGGGARGGVHLAARVNTVIREAYPRTFGTAVTRNFHDLSAPNGSISAEIYFVTHGCSPTPPGSPE